MWFNQILYTLLVAAIAKACKGPDTCGDNDGLTVTTITGKYTGLPNTEYNGVREFRSIPYAKAPVGDLRWQPPVALRPSTKHHYSHRFPPSCPQYLTSRLTLWNTNISDFSIATAGQSHHAGQFAQASTEDCLKLAVWTPRNTRRGDGLPVALFVPGGSFVTGGVEVPYQNPAGFVNHTQKHIVVTMNWRVNLFGFPNAAGLEHQSLGILDVRMALEWVYANIGAFGGDPRRIVLWGQSAGGVAADVLDFAYDDEPLVAGFFLHSGAAVREFAEGDDALQTNFSFVARHVGCDGFSGDNPAAAELECMRQVPAALLSNFVGAYGDNKTKPGLWFRPTVDDRLIFRNYTARGLAGRISRVPALISTTANEQASLAKWNPGLNASLASSPSNSQQPRHNPPPDQARIDKVTLSDFVCVAREAAVVRAAHNLTTYRYQWAGNYTNLTPYPWMGAYHASDVPMIFGTYDLHGGATEGQRRAAEALQDYVFAFLEDPENGIRRHLGWQPDVAPFRDDEPMVRFVGGDGDGGATSKIGGGGGADDGRVAVKQISAAEVDGACTGSGTYNPSPS